MCADVWAWYAGEEQMKTNWEGRASFTAQLIFEVGLEQTRVHRKSGTKLAGRQWGKIFSYLAKIYWALTKHTAPCLQTHQEKHAPCSHGACFHSSLCLHNRHVLSSSCVSGTVVGKEDTVVKGTSPNSYGACLPQRQTDSKSKTQK